MSTIGSGGRRYRSWPEALKREIVAASLAPGASVSMVARHYDVNANQVFSWRRRYREICEVSSSLAAPQLVPLIVAEEQTAVSSPPSTIADMIEIDLGRYCVRLKAGFDAQALRRVLDVLERR